jgi:hypothetical protein
LQKKSKFMCNKLDSKKFHLFKLIIIISGNIDNKVRPIKTFLKKNCAFLENDHISMVVICPNTIHFYFKGLVFHLF